MYMTHFRCYLFISLFLLLVLNTSGILADSSPSDLLILTEEYAPFNYLEDGTLKGLSVDLLESAFHHMGSSITRDDFSLGSWSEAYQTALTRNNTILFTMARIPEREDKFQWAGPIITDAKVLFGIPDENSSILHNDITSYRIVAISDDSGYQLALDAGASPDQVIVVSSAGEAIRMVENGTADVWSYGEMAGNEQINRYANNPEKFTPLLDIGTVEEYFAIQKDTDPAFVRELNDTLATLKTERTESGSSEYEQIVYRYLPVQCAESEITSQMVTDLVNLTAEAIAENTLETLDKINAGDEPYKDPDIPGLYVFVYTIDGILIADAGNPHLIGKKMTGKGDVTGKMFRDEMITGAIDHGTGWVHYVFSHPAMSGIFPKKSYYRLVTGSDGSDYVVISGRYMSCAYLWQSSKESHDRSIEMDIQDDGKILLAGTRNETGQKDILVLRYLPTGKNDLSFGNNGAVIFSGDAGKDDYAFGVTYDTSGNVLVAGREHNGHDPDMILLKYLPDGTPDTDFGDNGVVRYAGPGNGTDSFRGLFVQDDGAVLLTGEMNMSHHKEMIAVRVSPDGIVDETFADSGIFILNRTDDADSYGFAIAPDKEGRIVLTGGIVVPGDDNSSIATVRLQKNGEPDSSFGIDGLAIYQGDGGGPDYGNWVSVSSDDKIMVLGTETDTHGSYDIVLLRYCPDGTLDTSFGDAGVVVYGGSGYDYAWGKTIQDDGKIVIAGTSEIQGVTTPILIRYNPDGTPDMTFGESGIFTFEAFGPGMLYGVHADSDGVLYANGYITKEGRDISLLVKIPAENF